MKCNRPRPGFELVSPCPFPTTITITPRTPPSLIMIFIFQSGIVDDHCEWIYHPVFLLVNPEGIFLSFCSWYLMKSGLLASWDHLVFPIVPCLSWSQLVCSDLPVSLFLIPWSITFLKRIFLQLTAHFPTKFFKLNFFLFRTVCYKLVRFFFRVVKTVKIVS